MGNGDSKYRIIKTYEEGSPWVGFCAVVSIDKIQQELKMPNGDKYKFIFINKFGLRILEGEHKGYYDMQIIY